jgi:CRISPR-associated protein Cst2
VPKTGQKFQLKNLREKRNERVAAILNALVHLRGGARQAVFCTDVAPKSLIMCGLTCNNPIFNDLYEDNTLPSSTRGKDIRLKIDQLKEIIQDYSDRIVTPVIIGIRTGYIQNELDIRALHEQTINGIKIIVTTPIEAARQLSSLL